MKLESQVVSLELTKRLKDLGVKQESLFYWAIPIKEEKFYKDENAEFNNEFSLFSSKVKYAIIDNDLKYLSLPGCGCCEDTVFEFEYYSAFTVAELGDMLPSMINTSFLDILKGHTFGEIKPIYCARYYNANLITEPDISMANALAKMIIYLLENGFMKNE